MSADNHVTKIEEISLGQSEIRHPIMDAELPEARPLVLYVWSCSCGDACGYYLQRSHCERGAAWHRLGQ